MTGKYTCDYIHNSGEVCGRGCRRPEGCHEHWKSKKRAPCKVCSKPTSSAPGTCKIHAGAFYVLQFYFRQHNKNTQAVLTIQRVFRSWHQKRINSAKIIQRAVIQWLYQPGGPFMKYA